MTGPDCGCPAQGPGGVVRDTEVACVQFFSVSKHLKFKVEYVHCIKSDSHSP